MNTSFKPQTIVKKQNETLLESDLDNEIIFMSLETGDYIGINEVAAEIWKYITEPRSVQDIVTHLVDIFDVDENNCMTDTTEFLSQLAEENMLAVLN